MKKVLLVVTILLVYNLSYSQDYYEVYGNLIPGNYSESFKSNIINLQISADGSLDYGLIYWRLVYYHNYLMKRNKDKLENGLNYLNSLKQEKYKERNEWINKQIEILNAKFISNENYTKVLNVFQKKVKTVNNYDYKSNLVHNFQKNKDDFCRILFLSKMDLEYDQNINYQLILREQIDIYINKINELAKKYSSSISNDKSDFVENILDYWFIIKENQEHISCIPTLLINYYGNRKPQQKSSIIEILKQKIIREKQNTFSIEYVNLNKHWIHKINIHSDQLPLTNQDIDIGSYKEINNLTFQIKYKFHLSKQRSMFSYIKTSLLYNMGKVESTIRDKKYYTKQNIINSKNYTSLIIDFNELNLNIKDKYGVFAKLTTSIYDLWNILFLEAGVIGGFEKSKYSYDVDYNLLRIQVKHNGYIYKNKKLDDEKNIKYSFSKEVTFNYFSPILVLELSLFNNVNFEYFISNKATGISLGYIF